MKSARKTLFYRVGKFRKRIDVLLRQARKLQYSAELYEILDRIIEGCLDLELRLDLQTGELPRSKKRR